MSPKHVLFNTSPLVPHICVSELGSFGSDNGLSPIRYQAIIYTNAGLLSIGPLGTIFSVIYTRGQFWLSGIVVACVCVCVRMCVSLCVNHLLVRAITRDPFELGSPNLDQRCKRPWLRSLLFWGAIDLDLQGQI